MTKITWSGGSIPPGQFEWFPVSMGPLPDTGSLSFKALQTYSNGDVVRWIEEAPSGGGEPERPAPVPTLTSANADDAAAATTAATGLSQDLATTSDVDSVKTATVLVIVIGALGIVVAIVALVRWPKTTS